MKYKRKEYKRHRITILGLCVIICEHNACMCIYEHLHLALNVFACERVRGETVKPLIEFA